MGGTNQCWQLRKTSCPCRLPVTTAGWHAHGSPRKEEKQRRKNEMATKRRARSGTNDGRSIVRAGESSPESSISRGLCDLSLGRSPRSQPRSCARVVSRGTCCTLVTRSQPCVNKRIPVSVFPHPSIEWAPRTVATPFLTCVSEQIHSDGSGQYELPRSRPEIGTPGKFCCQIEEKR